MHYWLSVCVCLCIFLMLQYIHHKMLFKENVLITFAWIEINLLTSSAPVHLKAFPTNMLCIEINWLKILSFYRKPSTFEKYDLAIFYYVALKWYIYCEIYSKSHESETIHLMYIMIWVILIICVHFFYIGGGLKDTTGKTRIESTGNKAET